MRPEEQHGRIFDIQRYSVHDGTGIRTIVFLKGCILRCRWCCNPESQDWDIQQMKLLDGTVKTVGRDVTAGEIIKTVERDRAFYRRSHGGLTLSGGESLCQPEFAKALLYLAKELGFSTAMESMGCAKWETIEELLPNLDQYLMDIKHTDPEKHRQFTGKRNDLMLENAKKIAASGETELIIRVPVIPTFNETPQEIRQIAEFAASLPGVKKLHLLPYHRLGEDKYWGLGREYTMKGIPLLTSQHMNTLKETAVRASGLQVEIGG